MTDWQWLEEFEDEHAGGEEELPPEVDEFEEE